MTAQLKRVERRVVELKDRSLLVDRAYVAGEWIAAADGRSFAVTDPFDGAPIVDVPALDASAARRAIDAAAEVQKDWAKRPAKERSRILQGLVRPDRRQRRRSRPDPHHRAGQAAVRGQGRGALERGLYRVVRGGGQAHRRRRHPGRCPEPAHPRAQAAGRGLRRDHALELSQRHDHPQGRPGARRRLHHGAETGGANPALGPGAGRAGRARRCAEGRLLGDHHRRCQGDRGGVLPQPEGRQDHLHRLDRGRALADEGGGGRDQAAVARARRQRAVHRVRRCRSRCGGRRRDGLEVPQCRPDLRLRQPDLRPGERGRSLCRKACRQGQGAQARPGHRGGRAPWAR